MNAVVALCHFCEAHGPCILFCTQSFHSAHDAQLMMDAVPPDKRLPIPDRPDSRASDSSSVSSLIQVPPAKSDQCEACRSIPINEPGFVSYDTRANICYISQQHPEQPQLYSVVRQACVRSLNCEVCPGREGPIVFGEDGSSHVFSYTFNIKDSQARGFTRLYSLIVVMMDRVFLINSWPFLVKHFRALIDDLQGKAESVYSRETDESKQHTSRSLRSSVSSTHPHDHLRRIRTKETGRSLMELTGDDGIFPHLHKYFVFLLKAGGLRITECVLEGPPRVVATPEPSGDPSSSSAETLERPQSAADFQVVGEDRGATFTSLRQVFRCIDRASFQDLATHILKGNQVIVRGNSVSMVTSLIDTLKDLVPEKCCRIVAFSQTYKESFVCNFLGLSSTVEIPKHVISSDMHVVVDILPVRVSGARPARLRDGGAEGEGRGREDGSPLEGHRLVVQSNSKGGDTRAPVFMTRLIALLSSDVLSDTTTASALSALKEEWMNKVKVLYKFSQMGHLELPQKNERLTKVLHEILYVGHEDLPILQYWRSALSKEYKTHLMQAART